MPRVGRPVPWLIGVAVFVIYNANGREIGSYDTQPAKFLAREIVARRTLTLDRVVHDQPEFGKRPGFVFTAEGHYRSAYTLPAPLLASGAFAFLSGMRVVDPDAPLAPALVAKLTASLLTATAVVLLFFAARLRAASGGAAIVALGVGLGTAYWPLLSQALWEHSVAALGLAGAVLALSSNPPRPLAAGVMLALAGAARPQVAPAIAILLFGLALRSGVRQAAACAVPVALAAAAVALTNLVWFGHVLGAMPRLEAMHPAVHRTAGSLGDNPLAAAAGLLVSPSRGLLVFSPIVALALSGVPAAIKEGLRGALFWFLTAALVQLLAYASYSVWWGGHTYGPRYASDLLPLLVPLVAAGLPVLRTRVRTTLALGALAWSVALAATGAFCYPAERWNNLPQDVDRHHARLWDWRDPQFVRCWRTGVSPQNFGLVDRGALRPPPRL